MALRMAIFLLASLLLVTTRVSSNAEEPVEEVAVASAPPVAQAPTLAPRIIVDKKDCGPACQERCKLHSRQNVCNRACNTCCSTCKCVPPGQAGHKEMCGSCYTDWTTHNNRTKCP